MTIRELFRMDFVRGDIVHGNAYWKPETGECIFHDPDFDDKDTFCITTLDLDGVSGGIWDGYSSDRDADIGREEAAMRIVTESGWERA